MSDVDFDRTTDAVRAQRDKYAAEQRLRDAAPELLEACRSALDSMERLASVAGDSLDWNSTGHAYEACHELRAAITKATGGQP